VQKCRFISFGYRTDRILWKNGSLDGAATAHLGLMNGTGEANRLGVRLDASRTKVYHGEQADLLTPHQSLTFRACMGQGITAMIEGQAGMQGRHAHVLGT
jgi:hypothetical protein